MALSDFTIVRRSMTARLFSTVTTVLTVAVAVALLLVLLGMRDSAQQAFRRGAGNMHLLVSADSDPLTAVLNGIFYARPPRRPIEWRTYERLAGEFPLDYAVPTQQGDSYRGFPVLATTEEFFTKFRPAPAEDWQVGEGRLFERDFEAVLGAAAARGTGLRIGDRVILSHGIATGQAPTGHAHDEFQFEVAGILRPTGTAHDRAVLIPLRSAWILHAQDRIEAEHGRGEHHDHSAAADAGHAATAEDLTDADRRITGIYLRVATAPGSDASPVLPQVFDQLRRDPSITVASPRQETDRLFQIVGNISQVLVAMAGVVMVSSGIAIMLALYDSMEQRRRQIAVLRVLGASRMRIFGLVVTESALLGLLGTGVGIGLAWLAARAVAAVMRERLGLVVKPAVGPEAMVAVALATVGLAVVAGVVPAIRGYRTSVASSLRPLG